MIALAALLALQQAAPARAAGPDTARAAARAEAVAVAVLAPSPPVIDGRDDDEVWRLAPPVTDFREWQPTEGRPSRFPTEAKLAYDPANLYVFIRAYDPHPDSLIRRLERRDTFGPGDRVGFMVDGYHDRRSGFEFWVNAAGAKADIQIFDDREDGAWDGVWDVATRVDSLGWTAEFRVPLSQIRYPRVARPTFGLLLMRDIYRFQERTTWPQLSEAKAGLVLQFGDVTGIEGLEAPRRFEAVPYVVARNASVVGDSAFGRASYATVGADLKYRVASNLTLDATVNPDFGQVEADPSVLNLSYYETFYEERRPFFVAGRGVFQFDANCNQVNCRGEGLYYSRRIGRPPQLGGSDQQPARIFGAAKLTGQPLGGLSVGFLDAVTQRATGWSDSLGRIVTTEPGTNYAALRVKQDLRRGATSVGAMLTAVNRAADAYSSQFLASGAYAGAVDFRHRFSKDLYQIAGSFDVSRVAGSNAAMAALQNDNVHLYQRVGSGLPLDSARTVLSGDAEELKLAKVGGAHVQGETAYQRRSAGFEVNDLGYLQQADQQSWSTWVGFFDRRETSWYRRLEWNLNWWQNWTTSGLPTEAAYYSHVEMEFLNRWAVDVGVSGGGVGAVYCDRCARGGPAVRFDPYWGPWIEIEGDDSRSLVPSLRASLLRGDGGRSHTWSVSPELAFKLTPRFGASVSGSYERNHNDSQWFSNLEDSAGVTHYTFARLDQTTASVTLRLDYTFTPDMTLQVYAAPFVSKGTYGNLRELSATPRARRYDDRFQAYGDSAYQANPGGFNVKAFQSNVVFRWEYRPGSTLFVVWNQGRQGRADAEGTAGLGGDLRDLFALHPLNTFLVKVSFWLNG